MTIREKIVILVLMASRKINLITGEVYHVLNRAVQGIPIFKGSREYDLFFEAMIYYLQIKPRSKFSLYRLSRDKTSLDFHQKLVTMVNYCLMPNHFHLTLRQEVDNGIRIFIQKLTNSFSHYFNIKYKNKGPLFEGRFKVVRIEDNEQLIHLSRYIHLNPITAYLVEKPEDYRYSSYRIYLKKDKNIFIDPSLVLSQFPSIKKYEEFVLDQKEYQRVLDKIKHLTLE